MRYFIYCRKSTESEDRQILSIESQYTELMAKFGSDTSVEVVEVLRESYSAKAPGRPIFDAMLKRIEQGEADGIIAWHPDRLARNAIDGGRVIHLLDCKTLLDLKFATLSVENNSQGKFMLSIMFGYSKYYVDNLSENVKRGLRARLARGWQPNMPPVGYKTDREQRSVVPDPMVFPTLKNLFGRALSGLYTVSDLERMLRLEWGFLTPKRRRTGGQPLSRANLYRVLSNPFYAGYIRWQGELHQGKHEPMISWEEFERLQVILKRSEPPKPKKRLDFTYSGMIHCGSCGLMVTAENKVNRFGTHYVYYHCTRRNGDTKCKERSIELHQLENQITEWLRGLYVPETLVLEALQAERQGKHSRGLSLREQRASLSRAIADCGARLGALLDLRLRNIVGDEQFISHRASIDRDCIQLTEQLASLDVTNDWFEPVASVILFCSRAAVCFESSEGFKRRSILEALGSNPTLKGKILSIHAAFPFFESNSLNTFLGVRRRVNDVRTLWLKKDPDLMQVLRAIGFIGEMVGIRSSTAPTSPRPQVPKKKCRRRKRRKKVV